MTGVRYYFGQRDGIDTRDDENRGEIEAGISNCPNRIVGRLLDVGLNHEEETFEKYSNGVK